MNNYSSLAGLNSPCNATNAFANMKLQHGFNNQSVPGLHRNSLSKKMRTIGNTPEYGNNNL
jgi:hypothetical protein